MKDHLTPGDDRRKVLERVRRQFRKGIREFSLMAAGDSVLVGLSGGKDSMALLRLLGEWRGRSEVKFPLYALHVRMEGVDYQTDASYLEAFAQSCGATFLLRTTVLPVDRQERRPPCFLCSWERRKVLFNVARELGCNKIALGHHRDDLLTTALMNLLYNGSFATMPALLALRKMPLSIIRPLCRVDEDDLRVWAEVYGYQPLRKVCPHDDQSHRTDLRDELERLQSAYPDAKSNLWRALYKAGKLVDLE